jgi:hypothetical protein
MVMSVGFAFLGAFLCPALGDRSHHQPFKSETTAVHSTPTGTNPGSFDPEPNVVTTELQRWRIKGLVTATILQGWRPECLRSFLNKISGSIFLMMTWRPRGWISQWFFFFCVQLVMNAILVSCSSSWSQPCSGSLLPFPIASGIVWSPLARLPPVCRFLVFDLSDHTHKRRSRTGPVSLGLVFFKATVSSS